VRVVRHVKPASALPQQGLGGGRYGTLTCLLPRHADYFASRLPEGEVRVVAQGRHFGREIR
jgi:hypothetical protein